MPIFACYRCCFAITPLRALADAMPPCRYATAADMPLLRFSFAADATPFRYYATEIAITPLFFFMLDMIAMLMY